MPFLFLSLNQQVLVFAPCNIARKLKSMLGAENAALSLNCKFFRPKALGSVGFSVESKNFEVGGFKVSEAEKSNKYLITVNGLAKIKIYEMQVTAFQKKYPLIIDSLNIEGSCHGLNVFLPSGSTVSPLHFKNKLFTPLSGIFGMKKTSLKLL